MKKYNRILLWVVCAIIIVTFTACSSIFQSNMSDADYRKLYYDYRALVTKAIKSKNEANLRKITDEYISKTGKNIFSIAVFEGTRSVLQYRPTRVRILLPAVNYASSDKAHIYRGEGYVMCESNETRNHTYKDNIHIRMGFKR